MGQHEALVWWLAAFSALGLLTTVLLTPWLLVRLPADYFTDTARSERTRANKPAWWKLGRNLLGYLLIVLGILLLALPGQGLVTIAVGALLADFPGRARLLRWAISRGPVLKLVNRLRRRARREPLQV